MLCGQLISNEVQSLSPEDTVGTALQRMSDLGLRQLPMADGERLSGIIWEEDLLDFDGGVLLGTLGNHPQLVSVQGDEPFLSAVRVCQDRSLDMVPVLDASEAYIGAITRDTLFPELARYCGASDPGVLIVLGISPADYSLGILNRIVESNDAVITHLHTIPAPGANGLHVYLRLNRGDVASILAGFRRHDYEVLYQPGEDWFHEALKSNLDHLMAYLNV